LDTNILIYLSKQELKLEDFASEDDVLYISVITLMEAKGYNFSNKKEEVLIDTLCENLIKADVVYIRLSDLSVAESDQEKPGIILDYSENGQIVGIEVLNASDSMVHENGILYEVA